MSKVRPYVNFQQTPRKARRGETEKLAKVPTLTVGFAQRTPTTRTTSPNSTMATPTTTTTTTTIAASRPTVNAHKEITKQDAGWLGIEPGKLARADGPMSKPSAEILMPAIMSAACRAHALKGQSHHESRKSENTGELLKTRMKARYADRSRSRTEAQRSFAPSCALRDDAPELLSAEPA